jgi:hypothetical protein
MARLSQNATNEESWLYVLQHYVEYPDTPYWNQWRSILVPVTERGIEAGYNQLFRAGTSMHRTTFSTGDRDVLRFNPSARFRLSPPLDPKVFLEVTTDWQIRISYYDISVFRRGQSSTVAPSDGFQTLARYLQHLWIETAPEPVPEGLRRKTELEPPPAAKGG